MYQYRIYTENKNLPVIQNLLANEVDGYTLYHAQGAWHGVKEPSIVIEVLSQDDITGTIVEVAQAIKRIGAQESVLITTQSVGTIEI